MSENIRLVVECCDRVNYFTDMCSGSEASSYLRLRDVAHHSTLGVRVIEKKKVTVSRAAGRGIMRGRLFAGCNRGAQEG